MYPSLLHLEMAHGLGLAEASLIRAFIILVRQVMLNQKDSSYAAFYQGKERGQLWGFPCLLSASYHHPPSQRPKPLGAEHPGSCPPGLVCQWTPPIAIAFSAFFWTNAKEVNLRFDIEVNSRYKPFPFPSPGLL